MHHVIAVSQRVFERQRFGIVDIKGTGEFVRDDTFAQRIHVDSMCPRNDDNERAFPQAIEPLAVEKMSGGRRRGHGDEHDVRIVHKFVHLHTLDIPCLEQGI